MAKKTLFFIFLVLVGILFGQRLYSGCTGFIGLKGLKLRLVHIPDGWIPLPPGAPSASRLPSFQKIPGFWMTRSEIQVQTFCQFLNRYPDQASPYLSQVTRCGNQIRPLPGCGRKPIVEVSIEDAGLFCQWLSQESGRTCRLPTPAEWVHMASSGHLGAPYPWGWESAVDRAGYQQSGPKISGFYGPFGRGLVDVIGNVYEWSLDPVRKKAFVHGGAWSDRHEFSLNLQHLYEQPSTHRSADIGFRVLVEMTAPESPASLTSPAKAL